MQHDRFDKFSQPARHVLALAQEEARRLNHSHIGTEHLLLGLVREGEGGAAKVLHTLDVDLDKVHDRVGFIIGRGDRAPIGEIGLTPRARAVIELAVDESRRLGHQVVGTEHLLLGLLREGEGMGAGVLERLGVNLDKARQQTLNLLSQTSGAVAATGSTASIRVGDAEQFSAAFGNQLPHGPDLASLRRVLAFGQTPELGTVSVTVLALEDYSQGFVVTLLLPAADRSPDAPFSAADDDRGGSYLVVHGSRSSQGGMLRYALTLAPALDPTARQLRLLASGRRTLVMSLPAA